MFGKMELPKSVQVERLEGKDGFLNEIIGYLHSNSKKEESFTRATKKDIDMKNCELTYIGNKKFSKPIWGLQCTSSYNEEDPSY